ncbi:MAG: reverse transcriptase domain-containing protein, partial [Sedimenticola sp.]
NQHPDVVSNKLRTELSRGRISGGYVQKPFQNIKISPLGVVPKKSPDQFRLIHHLSYSQGSNQSVTEGIPSAHSAVKYSRVEDAIAATKSVGSGAFLAKTDIKSAFRIIPIHPDDYPLLGFCWEGLFYYDKCLPMGASSSCKIFEAFSTALEWIARQKCGCHSIIHILDDFLFIGESYERVDRALHTFMDQCALLGVPLSETKTFSPATTMTFMGISLDSIRMEARLPEDKLDKARELLLQFQEKSSCTLRQLLSLIGVLNFACSVIPPGRTFLRRLSNLSMGVSKLHHHVKLTAEVHLDMGLWLTFLTNFNGTSFFLHKAKLDSNAIQLYTDASGYGACYTRKWLYGRFPLPWHSLNITFLELYPIVISIEVGATYGKTIALCSIQTIRLWCQSLTKRLRRTKQLCFWSENWYSLAYGSTSCSQQGMSLVNITKRPTLFLVCRSHSSKHCHRTATGTQPAYRNTYNRTSIARS